MVPEVTFGECGPTMFNVMPGNIVRYSEAFYKEANTLPTLSSTSSLVVKLELDLGIEFVTLDDGTTVFDYWVQPCSD